MARPPSDYMCSTCRNGGVCSQHRYLGHFGKSKFLNGGHNDVADQDPPKKPPTAPVGTSNGVRG